MPDSIKILLIRLAAIAGAALFCFLGFDHQYGPLLVVGLVMTWFVFRSYDDWGTFLKRCVLAFPFIALVELSLYMFISPDHFTYWYSGILLFEALIVNVNKIWPHYFVTLSVAAAMILIALVRKLWVVNIGFYSYSLILTIFFYASYLIILNRKQREFKYGSILIRAFVSGLLIVLFSGAFLISHIFMKRHDIPFEIAFGVLFLLGIAFFIVLYNFSKDYFKADALKDNLFRKGKITESFKGFLSNLKETIGLPQKRNK